MSKNKIHTHVSLLSEAGGLDIGLEQVGFHTVWENNFNHDACETHRLWAYMESYMANLETKVAKSLTMLQTANVEREKYHELFKHC